MPVLWKRLSEPRGADTPAHTHRSEPKAPPLDSHAFPLSRNETIRDGLDRPLGRDKAVRPRDGARSGPLREGQLNGEALCNGLALLAVPQRTADRPEQAVERGEQDGEAGPEEGDARVDEEPLGRLVADDSGAGPVAGEPVLRAHTA